jgi:hypothetical protein
MRHETFHVEEPTMTESVKQELLATLNTFDERQLALMLDYARKLESLELAKDYDPAKDPLVGFFEGPPDLAERSSEILRAEFGLRKPQDNE